MAPNLALSQHEVIWDQKRIEMFSFYDASLSPTAAEVSNPPYGSHCANTIIGSDRTIQEERNSHIRNKLFDYYLPSLSGTRKATETRLERRIGVGMSQQVHLRVWAASLLWESHCQHKNRNGMYAICRGTSVLTRKVAHKVSLSSTS
jgi:hypothetical protein